MTFPRSETCCHWHDEGCGYADVCCVQCPALADSPAALVLADLEPDCGDCGADWDAS